MKRRWGIPFGLGALVVIGAACSSFDGNVTDRTDAATTPPDDDASRGEPIADAGPVDPGDDAADAQPHAGSGCNLHAPFQTVTALAAITAPAGQSIGHPTLSQDEADIYFHRGSPTASSFGLFHASRGNDGGFGAATTLFPVFTGNQKIVSAPSLSPDGLTLFMDAQNSLAAPSLDLYVSTRPTQDVEFTNSPTGNAFKTTVSDRNDVSPYVTTTGRVYFQSNRLDVDAKVLYMTSIDVGGGYKAATSLQNGVGQTVLGESPVVDASERVIYFSRPDANNLSKTYVADLASDGVNVTSAVEMPATDIFNDPATSTAPGWISSDGCRLYFQADTAGNGLHRLYVASRSP